jgi:hypothetical protein
LTWWFKTSKKKINSEVDPVDKAKAQPNPSKLTDMARVDCAARTRVRIGSERAEADEARITNQFLNNTHCRLLSTQKKNRLAGIALTS